MSDFPHRHNYIRDLNIEKSYWASYNALISLRAQSIINRVLKYPWRKKMTLNETFSLLESLVPAIIGGTIGILALIGLREFFRETKIALKKSVRS